MKKQKLATLKVKSFVTGIDKRDSETVKGGSNWSLVLCEGGLSLATCPSPETW